MLHPACPILTVAHGGRGGQVQSLRAPNRPGGIVGPPELSEVSCRSRPAVHISVRGVPHGIDTGGALRVLRGLCVWSPILTVAYGGRGCVRVHVHVRACVWRSWSLGGRTGWGHVSRGGVRRPWTRLESAGAVLLDCSSSPPGGAAATAHGPVRFTRSAGQEFVLNFLASLPSQGRHRRLQRQAPPH